MAKRTNRIPRSAGALSLLAKKYAPPAWIFLAEVRDQTGYGASRSADAFAASIWPSRGLHFHGFELKASRSDWLRELKNPEKAEEISRYCHYWWLVTEEETVCPADEVPATWGLQSVRDGKLVVLKDAPLRTPEVLTVEFVAAVFRRWAEGMIPRAVLNEEVAKGREQIKAEALKYNSSELERKKKEYDELLHLVTQFEKASGLQLRYAYHYWTNHNLPTIGKAVQQLLDLRKHQMPCDELDRAVSAAERQLAALTEARNQMRGFLASSEVAQDARPE